MIIGLAGSGFLGFKYFSTNSELALAKPEVESLKKIIKATLCASIIDNNLGLDNVQKVLLTNENNFILASNEVVLKTNSTGGISWNYTIPNYKVSMVSTINGIIYLVAYDNKSEKIISLSSEKRIISEITINDADANTENVYPGPDNTIIVHRIAYDNTTSAYYSVFIKYTISGVVVWNTKIAGFVPKFITASSDGKGLFLYGDYFYTYHHWAAMGLDENGVATELKKYLIENSMSGAIKASSGIIYSWINIQENLEVLGFNTETRDLAVYKPVNITRIVDCFEVSAQGKPTEFVCTCMESSNSYLKKFDKDFKVVWSILISGMAPTFLTMINKETSIAVFSEPNSNYDQRHQKYMEVDHNGKKIVEKEFKDKYLEIAAITRKSSEFFIVFRPSTYYGKKTNGTAKIVILPKKFGISDKVTYC